MPGMNDEERYEFGLRQEITTERQRRIEAEALVERLTKTLEETENRVIEIYGGGEDENIPHSIWVPIENDLSAVAEYREKWKGNE